MGRDFAGRRWGPRPVDLDIIFYSDRHYQARGCAVVIAPTQNLPRYQCTRLDPLPHHGRAGMKAVPTLDLALPETP